MNFFIDLTIQASEYGQLLIYSFHLTANNVSEVASSAVHALMEFRVFITDLPYLPNQGSRREVL